ncbi:tRNA preQ1(34) S-adenosylmethionine ribosyltransferase-isomerase QueA [Luminiphilus sp.]|nr:tRNA preQ1(34) S-adenosylmethionine ribosyltransferase-isomerase QueA [Luminiphilus sp.]
MKRTDFAFDLPPELIAQAPLAERSASRLLSVDGNSGECTHLMFTDLVGLLSSNDLLVFNNTRVVPARLFAQKQTGGRAEILVERLMADGTALAHVRASKSPRDNTLLLLTPNADSDVSGMAVRVIGRQGALFHLAPESGGFPQAMQQLGHIPLPPYIDRADTVADRDRYQTVYAKHDGAVAAPTAGLHFDQPLLNQLDRQGVQRTEVTLHVGAGTFQPVRADQITDHVMHSEYIEVDQACCKAVADCRARGGRVIAVGTTAVRSLESVALTVSEGESLVPYAGDTDIFLYPGSQFRVVDAMITNFHLPESTLLMLVSAFAGVESIRAAYAAAIANRYRFFSYGDAMFLSKKGSH